MSRVDKSYETERISRYYDVASGCRLAVDIFFPENYQKDRKYPLLLNVGNIDRRKREEGFASFITSASKRGYLISFADPRGVGASFGSNEGFYGEQDARDIAGLIEELANEYFCDGYIGMFGGSNMGNIQQLTACECPSHLRAIVPNDCNVNLYYQNYTNGASCIPINLINKKQSELGTPVDDDTEGRQAEEARKVHYGNLGFLEQYSPNMWRDSASPHIGYAPNLRIPAWSKMDRVQFSDIAVYQNASWYDPGCTGEILAYKMWGGKLLLGPWRHCEMFGHNCDLPNGDFSWEDDHLNFYDAVLKQNNESYLQMPAVRYYTRNAKAGQEWRYAADWPTDAQVYIKMYLDAVPSHSISSAFDGSLSRSIPGYEKIRYQVREDIQLFQKGKLDRRLEDNFKKEEHKCLTFTSEPLSGSSEITGIPVVDIWVTSTYKDGNFLAVLEEVKPDGSVSFITDGAIRASHGAICANDAWDSLGLPYHRGHKEDAVWLSEDKPLHLAFNMEALSYQTQSGSRIRLCIFCGDESTYTQPEGFPTSMPEIALHTGEKYPSFLRLPMQKPDVQCFSGMIKQNGQSEEAEIYTFKEGIYVNKAGKWLRFPCKQVYGENGQVIFETEDFLVKKTIEKSIARLEIVSELFSFTADAAMPDLFVFPNATGYPEKYTAASMTEEIEAGIPLDFENVCFATVAIKPGRKNEPNPQLGKTRDLFFNLRLPQKGKAPFPCIIYCHGFSLTHTANPLLLEEYLQAGIAVASVDYRCYPPNIWPSPMHDVKGAIRYLKSYADIYQLDPMRFAIMGDSMGGHMACMIAASKKDTASEGNIGGNQKQNSDVAVAVAYFPWTDIFTFGDDSQQKYPNQPEKILLSDGPYAPLGCLVEYDGPGKGMGNLKSHLQDDDPEFKRVLALAKDASPIYHVSESSAPIMLVHGDFEYGVQIPMQQSIRYFNACTQKGVKALLCLNNNGPYGADKEVKTAVYEFLTARLLVD